MESHQVQAPFRSQHYTVEEIDEQLSVIAHFLEDVETSQYKNKLFNKANEWLEMRYELTGTDTDAN